MSNRFTGKICYRSHSTIVIGVMRKSPRFYFIALIFKQTRKAIAKALIPCEFLLNKMGIRDAEDVFRRLNRRKFEVDSTMTFF